MHTMIHTPARRTILLPIGLLGAVCLLAPAQARPIDAGGQASLMQQHTMMRNQSTGDGPDWVDREALRRKNGGKVLPGSPSPPDAGVDRAMPAQDMHAMMERRRAQLLPEYERRVRSDGRPSADRWLREVAADMGRRDGEAARARYGR